jgi:glycosyltransferase involved in cell wall biosynthesis
MSHEPLRIIQVLCSNAFGGIERYVTTLSNGLADRACRVVVIGGPDGRMSRELTGSVDGWRPARGFRDAFAQLARLGHADVVHAHMTHAELAATVASRLIRSRVVVTRHFASSRGSTVSGRIAAVAIRRALDLQLAVSAHVAAGVDGASAVVYPGVPVTPHPPNARRRPIVLVLQRLEPEKETSTALRAWASSDLGKQGWSLHVVGDGTERGHLERLAAELEIGESCRFFGVSRDVSSHLATASILLAPAREEPFGLSVVEAMAFGLPVVATASGGHLENVAKCSAAMLFSPGDAGHASRLLQELAADGDLRRSYGDELRALQRERFTADRQVDETLNHYRSLLGRT